MGEGEGKKDVTDQIEDEEQLLGLKGDEPDKDQAEESKELGTLSCAVCPILHSFQVENTEPLFYFYYRGTYQYIAIRGVSGEGLRRYEISAHNRGVGSVLGGE